MKTAQGLFFQTVSGREKTGCRERFPFCCTSKNVQQPGEAAVPVHLHEVGRKSCSQEQRAANPCPEVAGSRR